MEFKKFALFVLASMSILIPVYAHPGNTDANGGHYDSYTGEYHYHHGFEAHYHDNGICPFGNVDLSKENVVTLADYNNAINENRELKEDIEDITYKYNVLSRENEDLKEYNQELSDSKGTSYTPYVLGIVIIIVGVIIISAKDSEITFLNGKVSKLSNTITDLNIRLKESYKSNNDLSQELKLLKSYDSTDILKNRERLAKIFDDWIPGDEVDYSEPLDRKNIYVKKSTSTKKYHRVDCKNASDSCPIVPIYEVPYFYKPCKLCKPQPLKTKKQLADELGLNQDDFDP